MVITKEFFDIILKFLAPLEFYSVLLSAAAVMAES